MLSVQLGDLPEMTSDEAALYKALQVVLSDESCKAAAKSHKRPRRDDDPDQDPQSKKRKSSKGPSTSHKQPASSSKAPAKQQQTPASGSGPTHEEEPFMQQTDDHPEPSASHIPEQRPESSKRQCKGKSTKSTQPNETYIRWIDTEDAPEGAWLTEMIKAQPPLQHEPLPGNTLQYAQSIMAGLHMETLTKAELRRVNREAFDFLKSRSGNKVELEYHMENIVSAISGKFDWLNPESNFDIHSGKPDKPYFTDWTKPLPLQGFEDKPRIPYQFFFNKYFHYLQYAQETSKERYASSLTIYVSAARYEIPGIEESNPIFCDNVVAYNNEALYGIQHWPERRRLGYTHRLDLKSLEDVKHKSRIIAITEIVEQKRFNYVFMKKIVVKRQD